MKVTKPSARSVVGGLGLILVGALLVAPVGAHVKKEFGHLWKRHIKPKLAAPGTINKAKNPLNWTKLKNVPAGFADGTDDVAGGAGGGDITSVAAGAGLNGGGDSGDVSLGADFSAVQARVSGNCAAPPGIPNPVDPGFGSSIRTIKADGTVICDEDDTGPKGISSLFKTSSIDSSSSKSAQANCPAPKIVISGGGQIGGATGAVMTHSFRLGDWGWQVRAEEIVPTNEDWWVSGASRMYSAVSGEN
jgi:hypothetical protein